MVHDREIKFTIADSNIARLNQRHMPDIRIGIPIHHRESVAWAVRKGDLEMLEQINRFFFISGRPEDSADRHNIMDSLKNSELQNLRPFTNGYGKSFQNTGKSLKRNRKNTDLTGA